MNENKLIIGIDIRPYLKDPSGMGQYAYQLTKHILENDSTNRYILLSDRPVPKTFPETYTVRIFHISGLPGSINTLYFHLCSLFFAKFLCDRYITTSALYVPALIPGKAFVVIHDLVTFKYPSLHTFKTKFLIRLVIRPALKHAKTIITVSDNTRKDLLQLFPYIPGDKVATIHLGLNTALVEELDPYSEKIWEETESKFRITAPYILFVGTTEPRKNLLLLIDAFSEFYPNKQDIQLVIAGKQGWGIEKLQEKLKTLSSSTQHNIIITGYITDTEKAYLYRNALIFVYPSLYEGFGMPLLEAMSIGTAVITGNTSSLPEVAGDAAILIDPYDSHALSKNMLQLMQDAEERKRLIAKGYRQIEKFDWNKAAKTFISLY